MCAPSWKKKLCSCRHQTNWLGSTTLPDVKTRHSLARCRHFTGVWLWLKWRPSLTAGVARARASERAMQRFFHKHFCPPWIKPTAPICIYVTGFTAWTWVERQRPWWTVCGAGPKCARSASISAAVICHRRDWPMTTPLSLPQTSLCCKTRLMSLQNNLRERLKVSVCSALCFFCSF